VVPGAPRDERSDDEGHDDGEEHGPERDGHGARAGRAVASEAASGADHGDNAIVFVPPVWTMIIPCVGMTV
jgi:hypothetical protein